MNRSTLLLSAFALALTACATTPMSPLNARTQSPKGWDAALYTVRDGSGDWGAVAVQVWTPGGLTKNGGDEIHVVMLINNDRQQAVSVDETRVSLDAQSSKSSVDGAKPEAPEGSLEIPARGDKTVDFYFQLPAGVKQKDISGFTFHWALRSGSQSYSQRTRFTRDEHDTDRYYYAPYDPYFYGAPGAAYWDRPAESHTGVSIGIGVGGVIH